MPNDSYKTEEVNDRTEIDLEKEQEYFKAKQSLSQINPEVKRITRKEGFGHIYQYERYNKFVRYSRIDPSNRIGSTKEYVFFIKPDLPIYYKTNEDILRAYSGLFDLAYEQSSPYYPVLNSLSYYNGFFVNNLLCNQRTGNLDLPDIEAGDDYETGRTMLGSSVFYRGTSYESDENFSFSLEFSDTRDLECYMWFRLYDEFERIKHMGLIKPFKDYIRNSVLYDQFAIYRFIVSDDLGGERIIHWSKYTGVYPKNVPRSIFSDIPADGELKFTINFKASFVEDMSPMIIREFNFIMNGVPSIDSSNISLNINKNSGYIQDLGGWTGEWMSKPYVIGPRCGINPSFSKEAYFDNNYYYLIWE